MGACTVIIVMCTSLETNCNSPTVLVPSWDTLTRENLGSCTARQTLKLILFATRKLLTQCVKKTIEKIRLRRRREEHKRLRRSWASRQIRCKLLTIMQPGMLRYGSRQSSRGRHKRRNSKRL